MHGFPPFPLSLSRGHQQSKHPCPQNGQLTFRYRDSKNHATHTKTLPVLKFISRFLQHVLPRGFQKVRTYGLLHPKQHHLLHLVKEQLHPKPSFPPFTA
ncbi:MAG: hypothetical protein C4582_05515 [Desulfobacteraceae bacterium]|nr:MAG: hypothetical protein C4582_05515 [Desulfobacteraceae bacterium]